MNKQDVEKFIQSHRAPKSVIYEQTDTHYRAIFDNGEIMEIEIRNNLKGAKRLIHKNAKLNIGGGYNEKI